MDLTTGDWHQGCTQRHATPSGISWHSKRERNSWNRSPQGWITVCRKSFLDKLLQETLFPSYLLQSSNEAMETGLKPMVLNNTYRYLPYSEVIRLKSCIIYVSDMMSLGLYNVSSLVLECLHNGWQGSRQQSINLLLFCNLEPWRWNSGFFERLTAQP